MNYRTLGRTGVKVSPLCLGAMMFGRRGNPDHEDCMRIQGQPIDPESRVARGDRFTDTPDTEIGQRKLDVVEQLVPLAAAVGATLAEYALAWTLINPAVTAPIIGPRTMEQLEGNLRALDVRIPPEHLKRIDELVPPGTDMGQ